MGEFAIEQGVLTGYEEWVLFANDRWEDPTIARPGTDCAIRWEVFGTVSEPTECVGCTHELAIDLTAIPEGPAVASAAAGDTWRFQAWFRDANPTATSNFTDAVAVTFTP